MHIGLLRVDLHLPASQSLKDKRSELLRIREKIRSKFNVSVSEVGHHDRRQRIELAVVMVAASQALIDKVFEQVVKILAANTNVEILDDRIEHL